MLRRDTRVDAALAVAVALVIAVAITANVGDGRAPDLVAYLFAAGLGLLMLVRRRYPALALVATAVGIVGYYIADYPPVGLAVPVAAALYSAAEQGRLRLAAGVALGLLALSTGFRISEGADLGYLLGYELAWSVALMAGAVALGDSVRSRRLLRAEQIVREEQRAEQERLAIARDLHDVLAHTVAVISLQSDVAREALEDGDSAAADDALATIRTASGEATRELRSTVSLLRQPAGRAASGSLEHVEQLVHTMAGAGLPVNLRVDGEPTALPAVIDTTAYRIVQESLTNAMRHANASRVDVHLSYGPDRLEIRVVDDGGGGRVDRGGHGLAGMRERAELIGGTLRAGNTGGGFEVAASVPTRSPR